MPLSLTLLPEPTKGRARGFVKLSQHAGAQPACRGSANTRVVSRHTDPYLARSGGGRPYCGQTPALWVSSRFRVCARLVSGVA